MVEIALTFKVAVALVQVVVIVLLLFPAFVIGFFAVGRYWRDDFRPRWFYCGLVFRNAAWPSGYGARPFRRFGYCRE